MKHTTISSLIMSCFALLIFTACNGQGKRLSPAKKEVGTVNGKKITINYSSPSKRKRQIFGGLVPYGKVWRTGANEATTFEVSQDLMVQGKKLPKGKYGLFTIPGEKEWTIIFNSNHSQWGSSEYDSAKDVLRVKAQAKKGSSKESFGILVNNNSLTIQWDSVMVSATLK